MLIIRIRFPNGRGRGTGRENHSPNPLHLVLREALLGAVVELGRARALVRRHLPSKKRFRPTQRNLEYGGWHDR